MAKNPKVRELIDKLSQLTDVVDDQQEIDDLVLTAEFVFSNNDIDYFKKGLQDVPDSVISAARMVVKLRPESPTVVSYSVGVEIIPEDFSYTVADLRGEHGNSKRIKHPVTSIAILSALLESIDDEDDQGEDEDEQ
jgi:hypothetical protein